MDNLNGANISSEAIHLLENFWPRITKELSSLNSAEFPKNPELPLARIKKIMKLDEEVKMISAEAPIIFAKAAELFIQEVTIRSWLHTEENKRRTLQRNDVHLAISKYDQFDFLIDIVPREEPKPKPSKKESVQNSATMNQVNTSPTSQLQQQQQHQLLNMQNATIITNDQATNLFNVINGNGGNQALNQNGQLITNAVNGNGQPVQYYFAMPSNGNTNVNGLNQVLNQNGQQMQLQNGQIIQGLQGLQNLQGLQGAQIIINQNGQPQIFSLGNSLGDR
jgi:nuclear transcription factor Y gamma